MKPNNLLAQYRKKNRLSRDELGSMLGIKASMVGHIELGRRGISPKNAKRWAPILGIPKEQLCPEIFA